jgi:hypothetical protein
MITLWVIPSGFNSPPSDSVFIGFAKDVDSAKIMGLHVELTKNEVRKDYIICRVVLNLELYTN